MFGSGMAAPSLADIAAVTRNNDGDGFGNGAGGWWVIIILFALLGGFGGYGYGGNAGGAGNQFTEAALQRGFDTQTTISKLDGINNGLCSLGYDQLAQMNGINSNIMQTGFGIQQAINNGTVAGMQNTNALSRQLAECCCENRQGQADLKYTMATDTCAITTAINQAAQNIMQNDNANYRQLHDENVNTQMQNYRDQLAAKDQLISSLSLAQSQANQNQFFSAQLDALYDKLDPCPRPAYWVQNPNCCQTPWGPFGFDGYNGYNGYNNNNCNNNRCCNG